MTATFRLDRLVTRIRSYGGLSAHQPMMQRIFRISGAILLAIALQTWAFYEHVDPLIDKADRTLLQLQDERSGNRLIDAALGVLRDVWRTTDDEPRKRQILELRDLIAEQINSAPLTVIDDTIRIVDDLDARSEIERQNLVALRLHLGRLHDIYADNYAAAISAYDSPPFYLLPTASLLRKAFPRTDELRFNHALYMMLVGDRSSASAELTDLRQNVNTDPLRSRILYAQARLHFDAFAVDGDPEYFAQALQLAKQSLQADASHEMPRLFLDYLLSIDQSPLEMESDPEEGQGSGESEGERGAISKGSTEH